MQEKQPRGLSLLFFTELWERFGFYTVQTILILYMSQKLHFTDKVAYLLYGTFSSMLYLTPAIGGYLADRYLGFQRSIIIGAILFIVGYFLCAIANDQIFFLALSVLIVANGFFKPNVSSIVGELYEKDDPRREGGFTIFYMGINIGSLIPPLFAGVLVKQVGWHAGFLVAALGIVVGLWVFYYGRKILENRGDIPVNSPLLQSSAKRAKFNMLLLLLTLAAIAGFDVTFRFPAQTDLIVSVASLLIIVAVLGFIYFETSVQRHRMIAALILILISVGFWALYNQTFDSLMLYADRNMNKHWMFFNIDAEFTQFFNPFFIIVLSPFLSRLWIKLAKYNLNPSIPTKFALGVLLMAAGFLELALSSKYAGHGGITSAWWLILSYLLQTIGELLLSPVGLAMITVLSSKRLVGLMMGVWFLSLTGAFAIGSELATLTDVPQQFSAAQSLPIYADAFMKMGGLAIILTVISFALIPLLVRLIETPN